ncbi:hypothetical protein ACF09C_23735 [Streptomyces sp. NPDC014870]|uniref:hypothetical protein n=1 Tax=Streptomyces sp. NPDC014870 TaxID=3364925 RepID=UPI003700D3AF
MSDQTAGPEYPASAAPPAVALPQQPAAEAASAEQPVPAAVPAAPRYDAKHAWIDGYEPGNPWQSSLVLQTEFGTVAYPLTPNTMPELLEGLVIVAQEQQGIAGDLTGEETDADGEDEASPPADATGLHDGRAARLTGWAVVHDLWEREDPRARYIMGGVVAVLLILGIFLA